MARGKPTPNVSGDRFTRAIPGYSLTQPKGKFPWDSPPREVDPDIIMSDMLDKLETGNNKEEFVKLMFAGVSIEEIVNTVMMAGFAEGQFSPDVAELLKGPLSIYLLGVADDYDVPVKFYANENARKQEKAGMDDSTILEIMRVRNPDFYEYVQNGYYDKEQDMKVQRDLKGTKGFLAISPSEEVEMEDEE